MKSLLLLALFICLIGTSAHAQKVKAEAEAFRITVGTKLIYHVKAPGKEYDFIVTVKTLTPTVTFDYQMTTPADRQGTVTISPAAMKSATSLNNHFSGGPATLTKETSIFLSQALYTNAIKKSTITIKLDGVPEKFNKLEGMNSNVSGNMYANMVRQAGSKAVNLDGPIFENADGTHIIRFQETAYFPIMTYLKLDFRIYLTDIKQD